MSATELTDGPALVKGAGSYATQTARTPMGDPTAHLPAAKAAARARRVNAGELVSNEPFRDRVMWLQAHDPEFSLVTVCRRLADYGYPSFARKKGKGGRLSGDTSHLLRLLGMVDGASSFKKGRRYKPLNRTALLPYDFGVALCRAIDADPVDMGV